jgi:hypothetical protein
VGLFGREPVFWMLIKRKAGMEQSKQQIHFGLNCRHLKRDEFPADGRCALAIPRYADLEYAFLDTRTPVSVKAAARLLGTSEEDVVRRAKAGEFEWFFPENIAKRITIYTKTGECQVTLQNDCTRLWLRSSSKLPPAKSRLNTPTNSCESSSLRDGMPRGALCSTVVESATTSNPTTAHKFTALLKHHG